MKLIIVDDEIRAVQSLVKRISWSDFGFDPPLTAHSMAQAQAVFQQQPLQLMLCDIEMPQGSGLYLFEWVKAYYPKTECIFVTCHDEYSYLRSAMQLGSCDYILKPVNYALLRDALSTVAERLLAREKRESRENPEQVETTLSAPSPVAASNPYISQLLQVLSERLTEDLSITDLADAMHLNPQYIMRLFKKEIGCSILQYITSRRIALAVQYLEETSLPITEVALHSGFGNYSYFARIFKRFTGETPAAFRKSNTASS